MAGGTYEHSLVAANLARCLADALGTQGCRVTTSDLKIAVRQAGSVYYPDVSVVCGEPDFLDERRDVLLNPWLLVEVLSPSTRAFDRGTKLFDFFAVSSLAWALLVEVETPLVEVCQRRPEGWLRSLVVGLESTLRLEGTAFDVGLSALYDGLALD